MIENTTNPGTSAFLEVKTQFRADTDQNGDWWVWRRLSQNGWATMRRCETREDALTMADSLNRDADRQAV